LWGKRDRIKRKSLIRTINEGGIGITDFEAKMKASKAAWVARILRDKGNLGSIMQAWLNSYDMNYLYLIYLIQTNIMKPSDFDIKQLPLFHKEVIYAFNECKYKKIYQRQLFVNETVETPVTSTYLSVDCLAKN
jgi:hypothetical protein